LQLEVSPVEKELDLEALRKRAGAHWFVFLGGLFSAE